MDTGLLIVSGGNELRSGAHRGMAKLAARLSRDGFPVFRFDRRGVGDSEGENGGFLSSGPDIAEEVAAFLRRSEEHTSELQSLMRLSYAVICLKKKYVHYNKTQL